MIFSLIFCHLSGYGSRQVEHCATIRAQHLHTGQWKHDWVCSFRCSNWSIDWQIVLFSRWKCRASFMTKTLVYNSNTIKLNIWDTAGVCLGNFFFFSWIDFIFHRIFFLAFFNRTRESKLSPKISILFENQSNSNVFFLPFQVSSPCSNVLPWISCLHHRLWCDFKGEFWVDTIVGQRIAHTQLKSRSHSGHCGQQIGHEWEETSHSEGLATRTRFIWFKC